MDKKLKEFYKQDKYNSIKRIYETFYKIDNLNERKKLYFLAKMIEKGK